MSDAWRTISSRLGWFVAVTFVVAMAFFASRLFHILVPLPEVRPAETFVDNLLASFEHQQAHWIEDLVSSLGLAAGFVGLALLGVTLRRALGNGQPRSAVLAVAFLVAGTIGAASQVLSLGATEVATNPHYCDCGFLAEEIVSREMTHQITRNVVFWMTDFAVVLFAIGLWAFGALASLSAWVPGALVAYSRVVAVVAALSVIWDRVGAPLLDTGATDIDFGLIGGLITLVVAGVLVPAWAVWVARAARSTVGEPEPVPLAGA
jgi:hypothetical protein